MPEIVNPKNKITLVFEVLTDGPKSSKRLGDVCRGNDTEYLESALQEALSELSMIGMDSLDVALTTVHGGNMGPISDWYEKFLRG